MNFLNYIKNILIVFLTFLLGAGNTIAKPEVVLPQNNVSFSIENTQNFTSLEKDELHISSVFHSVDKTVIDKLPAEDLRKYIDGDYVEHQLAKKVTDAGSDLLNASGKFIDDVLEADYVKYLARKAKEVKTAKTRLNWKKARDYWLNDSPLARGNNFNKKAWKEEWYPAWEVRLDNGKFIDGYNPFTKEIVSRGNVSKLVIAIFTTYNYLVFRVQNKFKNYFYMMFGTYAFKKSVLKRLKTLLLGIGVPKLVIVFLLCK